MAVFAYDPNGVSTWSNAVVNYLTGGSESIESISKKFASQLDKLVEPNVWTGPAAYQNYQNFIETHKAMVNFINSFGSSFENAMHELSKSVANLETNNLGNAGSLANLSLEYTKLNDLATQTIKTETVKYDYAVIESIGSELANINSSIETVQNGLNKEIDKLNANVGVWDGNAAETVKGELKQTLTTNMNAIHETLAKCISNIQSAAEAARMADAG